MTFHSLLFAFLTMSCVALATVNGDNTTTLSYPGRVLNTTQGECPADVQSETVTLEVKDDIRNLLKHIGKVMHVYACIFCVKLTAYTI